MATQMEKPRDVVGGLLVMAIGAAFLLFARELPMGSSQRMGPGYFPTALSALLIVLGAVMTGLALRKPAEEGSLGQMPWFGLLAVIGATLVFGFTVRGLGLALAVLMVVLATAWASRYASWRGSLPLAIGLTAFCTLLFIRGLSLPLPVLGPWLSPSYWSKAPSAPASAPAPATTPPAAQ
jgi:hypothetical protein